jgi:hypothetical protein
MAIKRERGGGGTKFRVRRNKKLGNGGSNKEATDSQVLLCSPRFSVKQLEYFAADICRPCVRNLRPTYNARRTLATEPF